MNMFLVFAGIVCAVFAALFLIASYALWVHSDKLGSLLLALLAIFPGFFAGKLIKMATSAREEIR